MPLPNPAYNPNYIQQLHPSAPGAPGFMSPLNTSNWSLPPQLQAQYNVNTQGLEALRARGLGTGPSPWANMMTDKQREEETRSYENLARTGDTAFAKAKRGVMTGGGLSSGAASNLASDNMKNMLLAKSGVGQQGITDRMGIGIQDENTKQDILKLLPGMEANLAGARYTADRGNIDSVLNQIGQQNAFNQENYGSQMNAWAAKQQGDATRKASCFKEKTRVAMADGSQKNIEEIEIGDVLFLGGAVTSVIKSKITGWTPIFDYKGVAVTGTHAVREKNPTGSEEWKRVEVSIEAKPLPGESCIVYNLDTQKNKIVCNDVVFADFSESSLFGLSELESIDFMNVRDKGINFYV